MVNLALQQTQLLDGLDRNRPQQPVQIELVNGRLP